MNKKYILLMGLGIAIIIVLIYFIGIDDIALALKKSNPFYILLAFLVQIASFFLLTLRWKIVNDSAGIDVSFKDLFPLVLVGFAVNNLTPSARGGGEPVKAYLLSKKQGKNCSFQNSFATVIADRTLDMFPFLVLAVLTIVFLILYYNFSKTTVIILSLFVIFVFSLFLFILYICIDEKAGFKIVSWILAIVRKFYKKHEGVLEKTVLNALTEFQTSTKLLLTNRRVLYLGTPISIVAWIFEILRVYLVFLAFSSTVSPVLIGGVFIVSTLVGMIPLLPGGLGAIDGLMIGLYSSAGISTSISAAVTVIERLISFWFVSFLGLICLYLYGISISETLKFESSNDNKED